jgi:predicted membrane protein
MKTSSWFAPQFVLGILIIVLGIMFMADNFGYIDAYNIVRFWPALLIVWGVSKVTQSQNSSGTTWGTILIVVGSFMLLDRLDLMRFRLHDWWPLILIIIGINFLRGSWIRSKSRSNISTLSSSEGEETENTIKLFALMSGVKRSIVSKEFQGGELTAIMGGCEIDFRDAQIKDTEAVIDVFVMWGGIELRVPMGWTVIIRAVPIMGGVEDRTYPSKEGVTKRLIITGNIVMGGVEIKN